MRLATITHVCRLFPLSMRVDDKAFLAFRLKTQQLFHECWINIDSAARTMLRFDELVGFNSDGAVVRPQLRPQAHVGFSAPKPRAHAKEKQLVRFGIL